MSDLWKVSPKKTFPLQTLRIISDTAVIMIGDNFNSKTRQRKNNDKNLSSSVKTQV